MTRSHFLGFLERLWEIPGGTLKAETRLDALSDWDSLAVLNTIAWIDRELGVKVTGAQVAGCQRLGDVLDLAGDRFSD
jgi:hypothetical protein